MSNTVTQQTAGILAATFAPLFMTLGFIVWDIEWKKAGGSAFALNMFKCNLASLAFLIMCLIVGFSIDGDTESEVIADDGAVPSSGSLNEEGTALIFTSKNVGFLMLSSLIGIVIGDSAWLEALRLLGATRVLVVDTVKPFLAAGLSRWVLGEKVHPMIFLGMALTITGVFTVSLEKEEKEDSKSETNNVSQLNLDENQGIISTSRTDNNAIYEDSTRENTSAETEYPIKSVKKPQSLLYILREHAPNSIMVRGYTLSVLNIFLDTFGSILTKQFGLGMTTWAINLIRFGSAGILMLLFSILLILRDKFSKTDKSSLNGEQNKKEEVSVVADDSNLMKPNTVDTKWYILPKMNAKKWGKICMGVAFVTFICPALSNFALFQIAIALAITLGSLSPLYALILEWLLRGKRTTIRGALGALLAVSGVVVLGIWRS